MKFLVVGLGSMGKRRIRNLKYLNHTDVIGCDTSQERRSEVESKYSVKTFSSIDDAFAQKPDAVIISTPPDKHYDIAVKTAEHGFPFFMEANVIPDGFDKVVSICSKKRVFYAPSCTMRFNPSLRKVNELVKKKSIGKVLSFVYHVGQYLPDWHPYEDYRIFYVSKKETGACREIVPFELNWLSWTFGDIANLTAMKRKVSKLESDIDDIYATILEFESGIVGNLVVDVLSRVPYRSLKIIGEEGVITWEWVEKKVRVYHTSTKSWEEHVEPPGIKMEGYVAEENQYIDEMSSFVSGLQDPSNYSHNPQSEQRILDILKKIEESSDKGKQEKVKH
ncbi:Oxidoreductase-like protein [Nitrosotalea devaniterrae]|uniref:Oxidoreductase-like protein n=1 Tax=Nitrosotalea devaniterrae TaxID=1078905 RepID=A0A128A0N8_9ARCH|nr:Oxidoreductase-like protein [Candidatus Nitrosotalea devanaterra]